MFENSELVATVLTYPILKTDVEWKLVLGGDPVRFLWPVPITEAELDLKLNRGYNALMELFNEVEHPYILNPGRASYV
jgi:hypothetical protein